MTARKPFVWTLVVAGTVLLVKLYVGGPGTDTVAQDGALPTQHGLRSSDLPLTYSIGAIDPRFGVSRERVSELAEQARKVWEDAAGRQLLRFEHDAPLKVNLVFDWRQEKLLATLQAKDALDERGRSFERLRSDFNEQSKQLQQTKDAFEEEARRLGGRFSDYNARVARWNEDTRRSTDEQRSLQTERNRLETERASLEQRRAGLNEWIAELAKLADALNALAARNNLEVENFNGTIVRTRDFEKGVFSGTVINVYEFENERDLTLLLVHEFGHVLGLPHVDDPTAIMNRKLALQDPNIIRLAPADLAVLRERIK